MRKEQSYKWKKVELGVCYYPEHWKKELWEDDLDRMLTSGIKALRVAEFAWSILEPEEGVFSFSLFDEFLDLAERKGMKVIFATPTTTPPAWLTEKYPEVLNALRDGVLIRHGERRHYNYNSPKYQELSARIVEQIAAHYARRSCIIGWQIDNELNCETDEFYSESDTIAFRKFLQDKYGSLDALNEAWGTVFWSQTYTDWAQIYVPRITIHNSANPHKMLDYIRFIADSAHKWCIIQRDILLKYKKPGDFLTMNGMFGRLDNHKLQDEIFDIYMYDSYPNFAFCLSEDPLHTTGLNDRNWSEHLTQVRSICPHFGIMEHQTGANGWNTRMEAPAPKPGQIKLWAMQSIAHGADYVSFFRWRTATMGTEIYWHGILNYDNRDNRKLAEIRDIARRVEAIEDTAGAVYQAKVGMLRDYDNVWDSEMDVWHKRLAWPSEAEIFHAATVSHTPLDHVQIMDDTDVSDLSRYDVLFYPHPLILSRERADLLRAYVQQGGTLIVGARTGMKDMTGQCPMTPMPGLLSGLTGTQVEDFTFVGPADKPQTMNWDKAVLPTGVFSDILEATGEGAEVLAVYSHDYYAGKPALVLNRDGKGKILHFGGTFTRENVKQFLEYTGVMTPYKDVLTLPAACELAVKEKDGIQYFFVLNFAASEQTMEIREKLTDLDTGLAAQGTYTLAPYETKVYRKAEV